VLGQNPETSREETFKPAKRLFGGRLRGLMVPLVVSGSSQEPENSLGGHVHLTRTIIINWFIRQYYM